MVIIAGKHLAEHCRAEYSKVPNFMLWVVAEIAVVACDIPEGMIIFCLFDVAVFIFFSSISQQH